MKMSYELADGGILIAYSSEEFVKELGKLNKFRTENADHEFMKQFAGQYETSTGKKVRYDNAKNFVYDLKKYGYVL